MNSKHRGITQPADTLKKEWHPSEHELQLWMTTRSTSFGWNDKTRNDKYNKKTSSMNFHSVPQGTIDDPSTTRRCRNRRSVDVYMNKTYEKGKKWLLSNINGLNKSQLI